MKKPIIVAVAAASALSLASCDALSAWGEKLNRALNGVPATISTYDQAGQMIDEVHGTSIQVSRDGRFDTTTVDSGGKVTTNPGEVLMFSIGTKTISHVGSSACIVQDGLVPVANAGQLRTASSEAGTPILNTFREKYQNLWHGRAKTIMIRSQDGRPILVFAGSTVNIFPTDVPKSTWFRVDGKYLWCYRVDYTVYDTALLDG